MDDLVAFYAACLDEDEANADDVHDILDCNRPGSLVGADCNCTVPARVLREVAGKRAILARYEDCLARMEDPEYPAGVARDQAREYEDFVLPNLAAVYSDRPGYRDEWKP